MKARAGFTLVEMMVAMAVGSVLTGGLLIVSTTLQRWFCVADYQIVCQQDQGSTLDYTARDIRRASAVSLSNDSRKLTLTIPDQSSRDSNSALKAPTVKAGVITYGTTPSTIAYYVEGNAFVREVDGVKTSLTTNTIEEFKADISALPNVTLQLWFTPAPREQARLLATTVARQRNRAGRIQ